MCQLTLVNTGQKELNQILALTQITENSRLDNKDGWGVFSVGSGIYKTKFSPVNSPDLYKKIRKHVGKEPAILHVRSASKNTEIKTEFNHPFETENLVLAHNGTLAQNEPNKEYDGKLDSEIFLLELDKKYVQEKEGDDRLLNAIQKTMKEFTGKFAFLIYEKKTEKWFAARGRTADLHIVFILGPDVLEVKDGKDIHDIIGWVINTSNKDLEYAVDRSFQLLGVTGSKAVPLRTDVEELEKDSFFSLDKFGATKIGDLVQNYPVYTQPARSASGLAAVGGFRGRFGEYSDDDDSDTGSCYFPNRGQLSLPAPSKIKQPLEILSEDLYKWLGSYGLTILDFDEILYQSTGVPLLASTKEDLEAFEKYVKPKLQCPKAFKVQVVNKIRRYGAGILAGVYSRGFQFPYMLEANRSSFMKALNEEITKRKKDEKKTEKV